MLLSGGWTIDRRPRPGRVCKDAVYIEPNGRSHWSATKAYNTLKKKVEDGAADSTETAAFTPIPEEEFSKLFRIATKGRRHNKTKKIIITGKQKHVSKRNITKNSSNTKPKRPKISVERNQSRKPCLLARSSENGSDQDTDGCSIYSRKRNLLAWMIDSGVIRPGRRVQYGKTRRQKRSSVGVISGGGICCSCCDKTMGVSEFVHHAGGKVSQPFDNVFLESGAALRSCLAESWRKETESDTVGFNLVDVKGDDPNDDTCNICGDGGNLICCDTCPSTFHQSCLDIQNFPSGDWNCVYCLCKFCRVVSDDSRDMEMHSCCLCEGKFHRSCGEPVNTDIGRQSFCGRKCEELFERLQTYLGVKYELEEGFSWTLLQHSDISHDSSLHETQKKIECNSKLAVAFSVMDECFVSIVDERSATNIIHNVVYNCGSNIRRLHFSGFFTAILEKGDELVSAASIRIHGHRLAEMPFIGTRHMYRRQGMCRRLLDAIESRLSSLGVEELVIPAIPELLQTWTRVFGFTPIEESTRQAMKSMSMMVFPGIDMLQKPLFRNQTLSAVSDDKVTEHVAERVTRSENESSDVIDGKHKDEDSPPAAAQDAAGLCDLNFPAAVLSSDIPTLVVTETDVGNSDDSVVGFVKNEQLLSSGPFLDCGRHRSPELQSGVENNGSLEVKIVSSKVVPKNSFDLNLQPTGADTDMHIVDNILDSKALTCTKLADLAPRVENGDARVPDSSAQTLVLL